MTTGSGIGFESYNFCAAQIQIINTTGVSEGIASLVVFYSHTQL